MKGDNLPVYKLGQKADDVKVSVKLIGFDGRSSLSSRSIAEWLEKVPVHHLQRLTAIEYGEPPQQGFLRQRGTRRRGGGHYSPKERKIVIYQSDNAKELLHALFHELGHSVYFRVISGKERRYWVSGLSGRRRYFVSRYAKRNAAEDFAESYAYYVLEPDILKAAPAKYRYFQHQIFSTLKPVVKQPKSLDFIA